jgi:hypothetical protein
MEDLDEGQHHKHGDKEDGKVFSEDGHCQQRLHDGLADFVVDAFHLSVTQPTQEYLEKRGMEGVGYFRLEGGMRFKEHCSGRSPVKYRQRTQVNILYMLSASANPTFPSTAIDILEVERYTMDGKNLRVASVMPD